MRLDEEIARSTRALALWCELRDAYDALDVALAAPEARDLGDLAQRIVALEAALTPLVADINATRARDASPAPAVEALWAEIDAVIESLAARQPGLVRLALAARGAAAERLRSLASARVQLRHYRRQQSAAGEPLRATSRVA